MSTPINLDLEFQDYAPSAGAGLVTGVPTKQSTPVVHIPDTSKHSETDSSSYAKSSGSNILNILQGDYSKGISEEALRQLSWASGGSPSQPRPNNYATGNWGLSYLSKYFDITTSEVLQRIIWSVLPVKKRGDDSGDTIDDDLVAPLSQSADQASSEFKNRNNSTYMERFIQGRPDLYGPFWISATLIFAVGIFSNASNFMHYRLQSEHIGTNIQNSSRNTDEASISQEDWHFSMEEMNMISSVVIMYVLLLPTLITFIFWLCGGSKYYSLIETICAYGYSLSVYVPMTILLMIQYDPLRYLLLTSTSLLSGSVLMLSFLPVARGLSGMAGSYVVLPAILICHWLLAYTIHRVMLQ